MIWLTGAIAFFALCQVFVGWFQWKAMKGQLAEMVKQYPELKKSADAAKSAVDTAQHTLIAMQTGSRPWLTLEKVTVGKTLGDEGQQTITKTQDGIVDIWQFSFDLANYGHLPASEVESTAIIMHGFGAQFIWRTQAVCADALPPPTPQKLWTAYPNRPKDVVFPNNPVHRENGAMSVAGIEDPQTDFGQRYLVVCLSYRDDSVGEMHHTKLLYHGEAVKWKPVLVNSLTYYPIETLQLRGTAAD